MCATDVQMSQWRKELQGFAVKCLQRSVGRAGAEIEADEVLSSVLMTWHRHPDKVPVTLKNREKYVSRACVNHVAKRIKRYGDLSLLGEQEVGKSGEAVDKVSEEAVLGGHGRLTGESQDDKPFRQVLTRLYDEGRYASALREELDKLAVASVWQPRSETYVRYWLIWLLELRMAVAKIVHRDELLSEWELEFFASLLARRIIWHQAEEDAQLSSTHPQLGKVWGEVVALLYEHGAATSAEIAQAFGRLGCEIQPNTYEQWRSRLDGKAGQACQELGVNKREMMLRLLGLLRPKQEE